MNGVLVDSDVIIELLRGNEAVLGTLEFLMAKGTSLFYSPISRAEIDQGLRPGEEGTAQELFAQFNCIDIDDDIGKRAGKYLKDWRKSHSVELGDALIAASAAGNKTPLFTFNRKHYPMPDIAFFNAPAKSGGPRI